MVNRLWAKFMGRGLVEPVDDMEQPAWSPELLDWLATDFAENGYDLRKTMERILTSQAYQLAAVPATEAAKDYVFRGPLVRRLSAEQFIDALASVTGQWHAKPEAQVDFFAGTLPDGASRFLASPQWIWTNSDAAQKAAPETIYFRKEVRFSEIPGSAHTLVACDNSFILYVNGKEAGSGKDHTRPNLIDIRPHLATGMNVIAIAAVNDRAAPDKPDAEQANPAGLFFYARVRHESPGTGSSAIHVWDFASDATWHWSSTKPDGWDKPGFAAQDWASAATVGEVNTAPWNLEKKLAQVLSSAELHGRARSALVSANPLMVALGRPNREQVLTTRASVATTLQCLELTNGQTLAEELKKGAEKLLGTNPRSTSDLVRTTYSRALNRPPTPSEQQLAEEIIGSPARREGVEDLLWAVAMLPEFQLIQ